MSNTIIYVRISTDEQETANQLPAFIELAGDLKCTNCEIFSENESAWKTGHSPNLKRRLTTNSRIVLKE